MTTADIIKAGSKHLQGLNGHVFDVMEVAKPATVAAATNLAKIVSKLSPLVGNLIEFNTCDFLNKQSEFAKHGVWQRQDPGFPDTVFIGSVTPTPGFEIKAWFPMATEITARFKDSQNHFASDQTYVALLAWMPEYVVFGKPLLIGAAVVSAKSVAESRDAHYHNPPDYLVLEPEDTSARTANLQQTNTNGYKFQGDSKARAEAETVVRQWGPTSKLYSPSREYQAKIRTLLAKFPYRLDTNYAKMDRIAHSGIEEFKKQIFKMVFHGKTIQDWNTLLSSDNEVTIGVELSSAFKIGS